MPEVLQETAPKDLYASKMGTAEVKLLCRFKTKEKNGIIVMSQDYITSNVFEKEFIYNCLCVRKISFFSYAYTFRIECNIIFDVTFRYVTFSV